jgi:hypothetical protein
MMAFLAGERSSTGSNDCFVVLVLVLVLVLVFYPLVHIMLRDLLTHIAWRLQ